MFESVNWTPSSENIYADFRIKDLSVLTGLEFRFFQGTKEILRYSFPLFKKSDFNIVKNNASNRISFPLSSSKILSPLNGVTINKVGIYLNSKKKSNLSFTISNFTTSQKKWLSGAVSFTFDDGYKSQMKAFEVMKKHNLPGTAFIIPDAVETNNYLTWTDVNQLAQWGWDISTHHQTPITQLSSKALNSTYLRTKNSIQKQGFSKENTLTLAYPMGLTNNASLLQVKKMFRFGRLASGGSETIPLADPLKIKTYNVLDTTSPKEILELVRQAKIHGDWVVLMFHYFNQPDKKDLNYSIKKFEQVIENLKSINANIIPMSVVLKNKTSSLK